MTTKYRVSLDRGACDGVFACLVRDDRFVEADDGLASIDGTDALALSDDDVPGETVVATFDDDRQSDAEQAAAACPLDAIDVTEVTDG